MHHCRAALDSPGPSALERIETTRPGGISLNWWNSPGPSALERIETQSERFEAQSHVILRGRRPWSGLKQLDAALRDLFPGILRGRRPWSGLKHVDGAGDV